MVYTVEVTIDIEVNIIDTLQLFFIVLVTIIVLLSVLLSVLLTIIVLLSYSVHSSTIRSIILFLHLQSE